MWRILTLNNGVELFLNEEDDNFILIRIKTHVDFSDVLTG